MELELTSADHALVSNVKPKRHATFEDGLNKFLKVARSPRLATSLLNAQVRIRGRASVPLSVRLRGRIRIVGAGHVIFGDGVTLIGSVVPLEFVAHAGARVMVGDNTFINYGSSISAHELVTIGRHCLLGHYAFITDNNEHDIKQHDVLPRSKPVVIEDHVWIGARVLILPGVHIGHHAVIGAGSVVTSNIPPNCVAVGNPARVVRSIVG